MTRIKQLRATPLYDRRVPYDTETETESELVTALGMHWLISSITALQPR
jgi:hypothetical protein